MTTLKRICRENQMERWPNRKRSCIRNQINKTVDLLREEAPKSCFNKHTIKVLAKIQKELQKLQD